MTFTFHLCSGTMIRWYLLGALLWCQILHVSAQQTCYFPDGTLVSDSADVHEEWIPCSNATSQHSGCCVINDGCTNNGLCQGPHQWNWFWRNGCTDPTWQDPSCPKYCIGDTWSNTTGHLVFQCDDKGEKFYCSTGDTDSYARDFNTTCCDIPELVFHANALSVTSTLAATLENLPTGTSSTDHPSTTVSITSVLSSITTSSISTPSSPSLSTAPTSSNNNVAIAVGVCVPIAALSLMALVFVLYRSRSRKQQLLLQQKQNYEYKNEIVDRNVFTWPWNSVELPGPTYEMNTESDPQELHGGAPRTAG